MLRGMDQYMIKKAFPIMTEPIVTFGKKELSGKKISLITQNIP